MENKYYTPVIEEFYVGFEFEFLSQDNKWEKIIVCNFSILEGIINDVKALKMNLSRFRVKYLDKEDIESLGWYFEKQHAGLNDITFSSSFGTEETYILEYEDYNDGKLPFHIRIHQNENHYFSGIIKNKSELIKLMKQLGI